MTSHFENFGPLTESTLPILNYICILCAVNCAFLGKWNFEGSTLGGSKLFIFIIFLLFLFLLFSSFLNLLLKSICFFSFHLKRDLIFLSRNWHSRTQLPNYSVCLPFSAVEKRGGFIHSRIQLIDIVFFRDRLFKCRINKV